LYHGKIGWDTVLPLLPHFAQPYPFSPLGTYTQVRNATLGSNSSAEKQFEAACMCSCIGHSS